MEISVNYQIKTQEELIQLLIVAEQESQKSKEQQQNFNEQFISL